MLLWLNFTCVGTLEPAYDSVFGRVIFSCAACASSPSSSGLRGSEGKLVTVISSTTSRWSDKENTWTSSSSLQVSKLFDYLHIHTYTRCLAKYIRGPKIDLHRYWRWQGGEQVRGQRACSKLVAQLQVALADFVTAASFSQEVHLQGSRWLRVLPFFLVIFSSTTDNIVDTV